MYEYEESSGSRGGGFLILDNQGAVRKTHPAEYGCLDAKWLDNDLITIACSDGVIRNYSVEKDEIVSEVPVVGNPTSTCTANILMTIDHVSGITATITAKGQLGITENGAVRQEWEAHSPIIESWCCAINPSATTVVSGSDDCSLKYWDLRTGELTHHDKRTHRLGTTCIEFLNEHELLSGSYDDRIRSFDMRMLGQPLREVKSIGGVWRLKPFEDKLFIAACYGGCQVLQLDNFEMEVNKYTKHESMAYGIHPLGGTNVVSCSFYDRSIQYWSF
jgi:diphthamide biosynthesis protein 7